MKLLFDFLPLLLFFGAFKIYDIYVATAVAIAAAVVQVLWGRFANGKYEQSHVVTLVVLAVFGGLTIFLRNEAFIMWKPSIVNWIMGAIVLGSLFIGKKPVIQRMLGAQLTLPDGIWRKLSIAWGLYFAVVGLLNIYVAFYHQPNLPQEVRMETWVNFKVFWMTAILLVFVVLQMFFVAKHIDPESLEKQTSDEKES